MVVVVVLGGAGGAGGDGDGGGGGWWWCWIGVWCFYFLLLTYYFFCRVGCDVTDILVVQPDLGIDNFDSRQVPNLSYLHSIITNK